MRNDYDEPGGPAWDGWANQVVDVLTMPAGMTTGLAVCLMAWTGLIFQCGMPVEGPLVVGILMVAMTAYAWWGSVRILRNSYRTRAARAAALAARQHEPPHDA